MGAFITMGSCSLIRTSAHVKYCLHPKHAYVHVTFLRGNPLEFHQNVMKLGHFHCNMIAPAEDDDGTDWN
jgi:hypothetical protein